MAKNLIGALIVMSSMAASMLAARSALADDRERLIGTWKLVEAVNEDLATGEKTSIYRGGASGFITYGPDGQMMAGIVDATRKKTAGNVANGPETEEDVCAWTALSGACCRHGREGD